jgi:hypothetical protein
MSPNVMCSVALESYHPYLQPQKVSKIQKFVAFRATYPKSLNSIYGTHRPLGVKQFFLVIGAATSTLKKLPKGY